MSNPADGDFQPDLPHLGTGREDVTAALVRSALSNIPIIGTAISEIVTALIPNQRIERIEKFLAYLAEAAAALKIDIASMKKPGTLI